MRPEFGCDVHDLVFDTIDAEMVGRIETAVQRGARPGGSRGSRSTSLDFDLTEVDRGHS